MTLSAFRDEVFAVCKTHFPDLQLSPGRDASEVVSANFYVNLYNLYGLSNGLSPAEREIEIISWFNELTNDTLKKDKEIDEATEAWVVARPLLRPRLVPMVYATDNKTLVHRPFGGDLILAFAIDHGKKDAYVLESKLDRWGVPLAEVEATAIANLEAMSTEVTIDARAVAENGTDRYLIVATDDTYDAERIVLPKFRARMIKLLGGVPIFVGIPNRDFLVAWCKGFSGQDGFIQDVEANANTYPYPLTPAIFVIDDGGTRVATDDELGR